MVGNKSDKNRVKVLSFICIIIYKMSENLTLKSYNITYLHKNKSKPILYLKCSIGNQNIYGTDKSLRYEELIFTYQGKNTNFLDWLLSNETR